MYDYEVNSTMHSSAALLTFLNHVAITVYWDQISSGDIMYCLTWIMGGLESLKVTATITIS